MVPNDGYLKGVRYNVVFRVLYVQLTSALIPSFPYLLSLTFMSVTPATLSASSGHLNYTFETRCTNFRELCTKYNVLWIADEVSCAY